MSHYYHNKTANVEPPVFEVNQAPSDTVSKLRFNQDPQKCLLFASSWDNSLSCWEIQSMYNNNQAQVQSVPKAQQKFSDRYFDELGPFFFLF